MRNIIVFAIVTLMSFSLAACKTFEGFGKDIQTLGSGVENTARESN